MNISVGDKVRFLNDVGGGIVSRIDGKVLYVNDEDGFEVPALLNEVVLIEKGAAQAAEAANRKKNEPVVAESFDAIDEPVAVDYTEDDAEPSILLGMTPKGGRIDPAGDVELYLINDSNYFAFYHGFVQNGDKAVSKYVGVVEPDTKIFLADQKIQTLDEELTFELNLFKKSGQYTYQPPSLVKVKLKGASIVQEKGFVTNDFFNEKAKIFSLIKDTFAKRLEQLTTEDLFDAQKDKKIPKVKVKRRDDNVLLEIDLHIDELLDDTRGLSNSEILKIQMDTFHQTMKDNLSNRGKKIVFIHGVGNGVLKMEVRKELDRNYKKTEYQDASFAEYGYGATMVTIR